MTEAWAKYDPTKNGGSGQDKTNAVLDKNRVNAAFMNELDRGMAALSDRVEISGRGLPQLASATTPAIGANDSDRIEITGVTTITGFDSADPGNTRMLRFAGSLTLTHGAKLLLPASVNIQTQAGDWAVFVCNGDGSHDETTAGDYWELASYQRADGMPLGRRGVADGSADDGVMAIDTENALATAGDYLYKGSNNGSARWAIEYQGYEYVSNAGGGGAGTLERVSRPYYRSELIGSPDFNDGVDITVDGTIYDSNSGGGGADERLDASSIIPAGAVSALIDIQITAGANADYFTITGEEDFSANTTYNRLICNQCAANGNEHRQGWITLPSDGSRKFSYFASAAITDIRMTILAWSM